MENKDLQIINKTDIEAIASTLLSKLESGYVNPLSILTTVKTYEKVFEKIKKELINYSLDEAGKYGEKEFELNGVKFTKMEAGTSYDYSVCGHEYYNDLCSKIEELNKEKKELEKLLVSIKKPTTIVMPFTGLICDVMPPVKKSTTTLKVTL